MNTIEKSDYFHFEMYAVCLEISILCSWRRDFLVHGRDGSKAQKTFSLQEVNEPMKEVLRQIDALDEVAADPDSEDDFDGEWCDEDGNLNLHSADAGCMCNVQLVTYCYHKVTMLWPGRASGI